MPPEAPTRSVPWRRIGLIGGVLLLIAGLAAAVTIGSQTRRAADRTAPGGAAADSSPTPRAARATDSQGLDSAPGPGRGTGGATTCAYLPDDGGGPDQRLVPLPPSRPARTGPVAATVATNLGALVLELDAAKAPCAVNAIISLAHEDYYTETDCHRLTTDALLVVQCGDPTGTGTGTPGYRYGNENLPPAGALWTYPRGTIAIANAGLDSNGAQFFIVYRDSELGPDYPIVGRVSAGMEIVDKVAAAGTSNGTTDGPPAQPLHISAITIG